MEEGIRHSDFKCSGISSFQSYFSSFSIRNCLNNSLACKLNSVAKPKGSNISFICDNIIRSNSITSETFRICCSHEFAVSTLSFQKAKLSVTLNCNKLLLENHCIPSNFSISMFSKVVDKLNIILTWQAFFSVLKGLECVRKKLSVTEFSSGEMFYPWKYKLLGFSKTSVFLINSSLSDWCCTIDNTINYFCSSKIIFFTKLRHLT